jgi:hypothetical protein
MLEPLLDEKSEKKAIIDLLNLAVFIESFKNIAKIITLQNQPNIKNLKNYNEKQELITILEGMTNNYGKNNKLSRNSVKKSAYRRNKRLN